MRAWVTLSGFDGTDPHWRYLILFYEYFHSDNGAGPENFLEKT